MRGGAAADHRDLLHETAFYGSDDDFMAAVGPFVSEGLAAGEPVVAAFGETNQRLIRDAFGDAPGLTYVRGEEQYVRPASTIRLYREQLTRFVADGAERIRVAGNVPHPGVGVPWDWWARYEAAANHVYEGFPVWALCPYDTRTTPPAVLDEVRRTHPRVATLDGRHLRNPAFEDPLTFLSNRRPAAGDAPPPPDVELRDPGPSRVRADITALNRTAKMSDEDLDGLLLGATEGLSNAIRHGRQPVRVRLWAGPGWMTADVTDGGPGPKDPFAGLVPAEASTSAGLGLWLTHQLCGYVTMRVTTEGFTIRLCVGEPAGGWARWAGGVA